MDGVRKKQPNFSIEHDSAMRVNRGTLKKVVEDKHFTWLTESSGPSGANRVFDSFVKKMIHAILKNCVAHDHNILNNSIEGKPIAFTRRNYVGSSSSNNG